MTKQEMTALLDRVETIVQAQDDTGRSLLLNREADAISQLLTEARRLRDEQDARSLAGRSIDENMILHIRKAAEEYYDLDPSDLANHVHCLLEHVAFLERLLGDADDLPRVRRSGYADGSRAALLWVAAYIQRFLRKHLANRRLHESDHKALRALETLANGLHLCSDADLSDLANLMGE